MMEKFDLIVIGAGSGLDVALAAAGDGLKVAIVERDKMGGTCLNRGCIPSKMLLHSADVVDSIKRAEDFGIHVDGFSVDFNDIISKISNFVDSEANEIEKSFSGDGNPKLIKGEAKFVGHKQLKVGEKVIAADKILIASGGRPLIPEIPGLKESGYITSNEALRLSKLPETMIIIGGGYIAAEMAHFFGSMGTRITILQRGGAMLSREDDEISALFTGVFSKKHNVLLSTEALNVRKDHGKFIVKTSTKGAEHKNEIESDEILIASGRAPNTENLQLENSGVKLNSLGYVNVDEYLETDESGIYALGDVVGKYLFKHSANLEAQFSYFNITDSAKKISVNYFATPHAVFTSPQVAAVGLTEREAKKMGYNFVIGRSKFINTGMGMAIKDYDGLVKLIVEKSTEKILGCHIIGSDAATLIHEVVVAMISGDGVLSNIIDAIHVHPALSEVIQRAAISCRDQL